MARSLLEIGTTSSEKTFSKTNAEVADIMNWFIANWAGDPPADLTTQAQINAWKLQQAHQKMLDYVISEARRNRAAALREEQTSPEDQAAAEIDL